MTNSNYIHHYKSLSLLDIRKTELLRAFIDCFYDSIRCEIKLDDFFEKINQHLTVSQRFSLKGDSLVVIKGDQRDAKVILVIDVCNDVSLEIEMYSNNKDFLKEVKRTILFNVPELRASIQWYYTESYSCTLPLNAKNFPFDELFPFVTKEISLQDYYTKFLKSNANLLLLIGPPGTGKTSFLKGLLHYNRQNAMVLYSKKIAELDDVFADFMASTSYNTLILEDCDTSIASREEGNEVMSKLLNLSEGLISNNRKKIIFTTNLDSVTSVDSALLRKGRCFDVIKFRKLVTDEANIICQKCNLPSIDNAKEISLAEIFNRDDNLSGNLQRQIGFY